MQKALSWMCSKVIIKTSKQRKWLLFKSFCCWFWTYVLFFIIKNNGIIYNNKFSSCLMFVNIFQGPNCWDDVLLANRIHGKCYSHSGCNGSVAVSKLNTYFLCSLFLTPVSLINLGPNFSYHFAASQKSIASFRNKNCT